MKEYKTISLRRYHLVELAVFALFAAIMFISRYSLQIVHGLHPLTLIIAAFTMVWRKRALILIYLYVGLEFAFGSFAWVWPYLYIFLPLWAMVMFWAWLFERRPKIRVPVKATALMFTCGLHGMTFGLMYAPAQMLIMRITSWEAIAAWIVAGLPFDAVHAGFQFALGLLVLPIAALLEKLRRSARMT